MEHNEASAAGLVTNQLVDAAGSAVMSLRGADVGRNREEQRRKRLWRLATFTGLPAALLWWRIVVGHPMNFFQLPHVDPMVAFVVAMIVVLLLATVAPFLFFGRSPHVMYRPEQLDVHLDDVVGIDIVKEEVVRSLNLFLAHKTFAGTMGGTPRRGLLFEGAPGTGKTYTAKAMAAEAGVPFLFVSATAFQSMMYGATAMKIRKFFKEARKAALAEGGAIAFIEEIDAIGATRRGLSMTAAPDVAPSTIARPVQCCGAVTSLPSTFLSSPATSSSGTGVVSNSVMSNGLVRNGFMSEGVGGVVNELLVQMQSFDQPTGWQKLISSMTDSINLLLPMHRQIRKGTPPKPNVLVIAATNRADSLDPALLRPGRFDRALTFERPDMRGRRALLDFYLTKKAHAPELDDDERRDALASITHGYTPVMIEHLFDEALINAVRRGDVQMNWKDVEQARLTEEVGLGQPVTYTDHERRLIATHEAGHATAAYLVAPDRRLEVLSIIKRREALGMLAHGDAEEVYTRSRSEMLALIQIAMAGQVAEELFFNDVSTGPSGDLLYATNVAVQMVGAAGMAGSLISLVAVQGGAFNDSNLVGRVLGDNDGRRRVEELLQEQKTVVKGKLEANQHLIAALRDALMERHELIGHEITDVLKAAEITGEPSHFAAAPSPVEAQSVEAQSVEAQSVEAQSGEDAAPLVIDLRDNVVEERAAN